ncbi:hypothetical protein A9B99_15610 [Mangrovibacter phragmitis]|uniref:Uncharacterized protein n=1 Tax=Mangrovibacter phragmitis TaxID=1691903 RepID=A0A1B7KYV6_9ENTR|nr:hypothetical protein [Mangrovibacter phragmitis]OAT75299.1 hypothetical protein A9B99_15610 [Mangrovibacter phragmitis]
MSLSFFTGDRWDSGKNGFALVLFFGVDRENGAIKKARDLHRPRSDFNALVAPVSERHRHHRLN